METNRGEVERVMTGYAMNIDGRVFVPMSAMSMLLGVPERNIHWDHNARSILIITADGRHVRFEIDTPTFWINNNPVSMGEMNAFGVWDPGYAQAPHIFEHPYNPADPNHWRAMIPFRQLGNALGIEVDWVHGEAIFRPIGFELAEEEIIDYINNGNGQ